MDFWPLMTLDSHPLSAKRRRSDATLSLAVSRLTDDQVRLLQAVRRQIADDFEETHAQGALPALHEQRDGARRLVPLEIGAYLVEAPHHILTRDNITAQAARTRRRG